MRRQAYLINLNGSIATSSLTQNQTFCFLSWFRMYILFIMSLVSSKYRFELGLTDKSMLPTIPCCWKMDYPLILIVLFFITEQSWSCYSHFRENVKDSYIIK